MAFVAGMKKTNDHTEPTKVERFFFWKYLPHHCLNHHCVDVHIITELKDKQIWIENYTFPKNIFASFHIAIKVINIYMSLDSSQSFLGQSQLTCWNM